MNLNALPQSFTEGCWVVLKTHQLALQTTMDFQRKKPLIRAILFSKRNFSPVDSANVVKRSIFQDLANSQSCNRRETVITLDF